MTQSISSLKVIRARPGHEKILSRYFMENEEHLKPWSPLVPRNHHSVEAWARRLNDRESEFQRGLSAHFIGTDETESEVAGSCSLSNIVRGVFQACHMGYSVAERYQGKGYMMEIAGHAIDFAFTELKLHRVMANYMPANERSANLLEKLGFEREGFAKDYILINGEWEDHVLTSLINPQHGERHEV